MGISLGKVIVVSASMLVSISSAEWAGQGSYRYPRRYSYNGDNEQASSSHSRMRSQDPLKYQSRGQQDEVEFGMNTRESRTIASRHGKQASPSYSRMRNYDTFGYDARDRRAQFGMEPQEFRDIGSRYAENQQQYEYDLTDQQRQSLVENKVKLQDEKAELEIEINGKEARVSQIDEEIQAIDDQLFD